MCFTSTILVSFTSTRQKHLDHSIGCQWCASRGLVFKVGAFHVVKAGELRVDKAVDIFEHAIRYHCVSGVLVDKAGVFHFDKSGDFISD